MAETAPISLYIELEPGSSAELEAVARASLSFAAGVREVAFLYDPSFEFRLELDRGDEGSLWLKAALRWIRGNSFPTPTMLGVVTAAGFFFGNVGNHIFDEAWDATFHGSEIKLTQAELQTIVDRAAKAASSPTADRAFRNVYRELETDRKVRGVGLSASHSRPPPIIIPRAEFASRAAGETPPDLPGEKRKRTDRGDFVIIRAVLKEGGGKWRLRGYEGEFSAVIVDAEFNDAILEGTAPVPLAAEIHMNADLETTEERTPEGAWRPVSYKITKVYSIDRQPKQRRLIGPPN